MSQSSVRLELKTLPGYHPAGSDIYIAGSFNGWNPQDKNYRFQRNGNGDYYFDLKLDNGKYEYKITRGGWDKVECKKGGAGIGNHVLVMPGDGPIQLNIEEWADRFPAQPRKSTAGKNVHIIDTAFLIPQLQRVRRVWIYLPEGYSASKDRYPVLYMHDGQNVFDDATSYSGEWGVDECLDTMTKKCIVVAVDHGGVKRINEYCPYDMERFGKGEGDQYVDHGVYVFINDGRNHFKQEYFFPMHGCFKALARDFDGDGDLDIAAISFFADYNNHPEESFLYLENKAELDFQPYSVPGTTSGRWLTMDAGDLDADGKTDLVLGNFSIAPASVKAATGWKEGPPFIILKNIIKK